MKTYHTQTGTNIGLAKVLLEQNELVAIPTETVYGLAANAFSPEAVEKIFQTKNRPTYNPLIVHVADQAQLSKIVKNIPKTAEKLLAAFSPGPLTLLLPKNDCIPDIVTAGLPDVAIRIPSHPLALALLTSLDFPLAAPSANPFGYISPTETKHVQDMLSGKIPYILEGGLCDAGIESTIVGYEDGHPIIYRQGVITREQIEACIGKVEISKTQKILSPGMLASHYSPHTPLFLTDDVHKKIKEFGAKKIGLITHNQYDRDLPHEQQILLYTSDNLAEGAQNLYAALHQMDAMSLDAIIVKKLPDEGIGAAINDRLSRASQKES